MKEVEKEKLFAEKLNNRSINSRLRIMKNKDIFEQAIGRPAMMGFVLLCGVYLTTGQLIPGIV